MLGKTDSVIHTQFLLMNMLFRVWMLQKLSLKLCLRSFLNGSAYWALQTNQQLLDSLRKQLDIVKLGRVKLHRIMVHLNRPDHTEDIGSLPDQHDSAWDKDFVKIKDISWQIDCNEVYEYWLLWSLWKSQPWWSSHFFCLGHQLCRP